MDGLMLMEPMNAIFLPKMDLTYLGQTQKTIAIQLEAN